MRGFEPIAAPITALGGAVAAVRVSGEGAWAVVRSVFPSLPPAPEPRRAVYGRFAHGDDGLVLPFAAGASYTGEESAEMFVHGSRPAVEALTAGLRAAGARDAGPGEFTLRAFLHGRLSLDEAEAVRASVEARTEAERRAADAGRGGALHRAVAPLIEEVEAMIAEIEARTDFEEEVGPLARGEFAIRSSRLGARIAALREGERAGRLLEEGARVAIVGPPNAGKSSLFNAVVGRERAIVSPRPGTTRDVLEATVELDGLRVTLLDTAGLRETDDEIERIGVARAAEAEESADVVWSLLPAPAPRSGDGRTIPVESLSDLAPAEGSWSVSARTGAGVPELLRETRRRLLDRWPEVVVPPRPALLLAEAEAAVAEAAGVVAGDFPPDLAVVLLTDARTALGRITGEAMDPDALDRIFARFCVGK